MKRNYKDNFVLQNIFYHLVSFLAKGSNNYLHFYLDEGRIKDPHSISSYCSTDSGVDLPVYESYRYSIKQCWKYYNSLAALHFLIQNGLTASVENDFFPKGQRNENPQQTSNRDRGGDKQGRVAQPGTVFSRNP